jgi:hypothetical protein
MEEYAELDVDRTTRRAWRRFQVALADHIVAMEDDDGLVVEAEVADDGSTGSAPYVQFCAWGDDLVRAEVSSNQYLCADVALGPDAEATLGEMGWQAPTHEADDECDQSDQGSANFHLDTERREGDRVAAMAVAALRDVFGVPHPAFLDWPPAEEEPPAAHVGSSDDRVDEPLAVMPQSHEHLRELARAAINPPGGQAPAYDDDGDIPFRLGSALLYVRVLEESPVVEAFAFVVRGDLDRKRAAFDFAVLNRDTRMVKFMLLDDAVLAALQVSAAPFSPRNLRTLVVSMANTVDRIDDDLAARIGGRLGTEPEPEAADSDVAPTTPKGEHPLHPALQTLLELDPDGTGDIDPELAASVCDFDRDLVLALLRQAGEHEREWLAWSTAVETLRSALRLIVERRLAAAEGDELARRDQ